MSGAEPPAPVAIAESPSLFRALFAAYPDALLLVDAAGCIVLANPSAEQLLAARPGELHGLPVDALVPDGTRSRHAALRGAYAQGPRARPMGKQTELVARRRNGDEVVVEISLSPVQDHGRAYVVAAIRDVESYPRVVQAQRRAHYSEHVAHYGRLSVDTRDLAELLRQVPRVAAEALQADAAALFLLEPDGQMLRLVAGFGLVGDEHVGQLVPNRPDTPPGFLLASGKPFCVSDYLSETRFPIPPLRLAAGLRSALGVPLTDLGQGIGVLAVRSRRAERFGDDEVHFLASLANLVAARLRNERSEAALQHAQRLETVGQLTGGIAHDFNNLLTVIQGNLQVLEEHPALVGDESALAMVDAAARASRRGAELTAKLLAFARRQVLSPRPVDMAALLGSLVDMLCRTIDRRIQVEVDVAPGCPPCVADPGQLETALLNIAINARDAMPDGGSLRFAAHVARGLPPEVTGDAHPDAAAEYVAIDITDTGTGMKPEVRERAFEPFFTTKEAGRGTGLGLSTVYGFVKQSRGAVRCLSALGAGTTITLYLPAATGQSAQAVVASGAASPLPPALQVMLVEDEPEVRAAVQAQLVALGCNVVCCAAAEDALLRLSGGDACDLLLSDVALGAGMRGTRLVERLRVARPDVARVLMSGYSLDLVDPQVDDARAGEAEQGDAVPLLRKPFDRARLAEAMVQALAKRRTEPRQ